LKIGIEWKKSPLIKGLIRTATLKNFKTYNKELRSFLLDQTRRILRARRGAAEGKLPGEEEAEEAEAEERLELEELRQKLEAREKLWKRIKFFIKYVSVVLVLSLAIGWLIRYNQKDERYSKLGKVGEKWKRRGWMQPEPSPLVHSKKLLDDLEKLRYMQERTSLSRFLHSQLTTYCINNNNNENASNPPNINRLCNEMYKDWRMLTMVKNKE
jgi:hypothetical protein